MAAAKEYMEVVWLLYGNPLMAKELKLGFFHFDIFFSGLEHVPKVRQYLYNYWLENAAMGQAHCHILSLSHPSVSTNVVVVYSSQLEFSPVQCLA